MSSNPKDISKSLGDKNKQPPQPSKNNGSDSKIGGKPKTTGSGLAYVNRNTWNANNCMQGEKDSNKGKNKL